jgi:predicted transcriptional regulator of viral defense system
MKEIEFVKNQLNRMPKGVPFTIQSITANVSYAYARQVLSRLVKAGEIMRATRGLYVRPKVSPYFGKVLPSSEVIVKAISKQTGETITHHGAEAVRMLELSTQVPMRPIYYTSGTSRKIKVGKQIITLKHISPRKQIKPGTVTCTVITALWYLGKQNMNELVVKKIKEQLSEKQFSDVLKHVNNMPVWMSDVFKQYQK